MGWLPLTAIRSATLRTFALLFGAACTGSSKDTGDALGPIDVVEDGPLTTIRTSIRTDDGGTARVPVEVEAGQSAMLVTASADGADVSVERVDPPSGRPVLRWQDWYDDDRLLTSAIFPYGAETVLNWPVRAEDGPLVPGTWVVEIAATDADGYYLPDVPLDLVLQLRRDVSEGLRTVRAQVVYAEDVRADAAVVEAVEGAVARWAEVWAARGIGLEVAYATADFASPVPNPSRGDDDITDWAAAGAEDDVVVLVGETIQQGNGIYGIAGAVPGTLVESPHAAVAVSWLTNAGGDGVFSPDDVRLFGETLAHEVGHYAGLFHPVEDGWRFWDALDDTVECETLRDCEAALGDNLMFPYPVCTWTECLPQGELTAGQAGVALHYTGAL